MSREIGVSLEDVQGGEIPSPSDFAAYLPYACVAMGIETPIEVVKLIEARGDLERSRQKSARSLSKANAPTVDESVVSFSKTNEYFKRKSAAATNGVNVYCFYDKYNMLTGFEISNCTLPREILKIIAHIIVHQPLLQMVTIKAKIDKYAVSEVMKMQRIINLTEVSFDGTFVKEANYYALLNENCALRSMSLARCKLNEEATRMIAERLMFPKQASKTLHTLNLSSNRIGDGGCVYLAEALRTNRCLRYLNVADNQISDFGAESILNKLLEFPLTEAEVMDKKRRRFEFVKEKNAAAVLAAAAASAAAAAAALKTITHSSKADKSISTKSAADKNISARAAAEKKKKTSIRPEADEETGVYLEPFETENVILIGNAYFSKGNNVLAYINFGFNRLGYPTAVKLLKVLEHQKCHTMKERGLVRVILNGNRIPSDCYEMGEVDNIFNSLMSTYKKGQKLRGGTGGGGAKENLKPNIKKTGKSEIDSRKGQDKGGFPELLL